MTHTSQHPGQNPVTSSEALYTRYSPPSTPSEAPPTGTEYVRRSELCRRLGGISRSQSYRMERDGRLPPPIRVGGIILWSWPAVVAHIEGGAQ